MIQYHCIYCKEQTAPKSLPRNEEERAWLRAFLEEHEACGPKAVGATFSTMMTDRVSNDSF